MPRPPPAPRPQGSQGLALLLESRAGDTFTVAGSVTTGEQAVALVGREAADIAIVDLALPPLGGVETIRRIGAAYPATHVLALSGTEDLGLATAAIRAGAAGFLGKSTDPEVLVAPLLAIVAGVRVDRPDLLDALLLAGDRLLDAVITVDMPGKEIHERAGAGPEPNVELFMTADTGNRFWLGKVVLPVALAKGQVRAKARSPSCSRCCRWPADVRAVPGEPGGGGTQPTCSTPEVTRSGGPPVPHAP